MNSITNAFTNGKAFIAFITAGDPALETTEKLILAIEQAGADLIEIGIPFSDPVAEGEAIQGADRRALAGGATTDKIFDMVKHVKGKVHIPLVFMTYINPVFTYGVKRFMQKCRDCGIAGIIIPDLPFEEKEEVLPACRDYGITLISMIAPTSNERISIIAAQAEGFVYCVSSLGVTGVRSEITTNIGDMVALVKKSTNTPCAIGFGISTSEQARAMAKSADGVIVGSAIVKLIAQYGTESIQPVYDYVKSIKQAISKE
nr:tryptophan synthase subunit alpha [uncultured Caproiciproducens sp.]